MTEKRIIYLTDRRPIEIKNADWPVVVNVSDSEHDGEISEQANRRSAWKLIVRNHRATNEHVVYAEYHFHTVFPKERNLVNRAGRLSNNLDQAIKDVCYDMMQLPHHDNDALRWRELQSEAFHGLPPEIL